MWLADSELLPALQLWFAGESVRQKQFSATTQEAANGKGPSQHSVTLPAMG